MKLKPYQLTLKNQACHLKTSQPNSLHTFYLCEQGIKKYKFVFDKLYKFEGRTCS